MNHPPDRFEKGVRFGCGLLAGFFFGFLGAIKFAEQSLSGPMAVAAVLGLVFGLLSMKYGDRFWHSVKNWLWFDF